MIGRLIVAVCWGVIVFLVCLLLGTLLVELHVEFATTVGGWLKTWAGVLGLIAGVLQFFGGWGPNLSGRL